MLQTFKTRRRWDHLLRIACCLILACGLLGALVQGAAADDDGSGTPAAVESVGAAETATPEPAVEATEPDPAAADAATEIATETPAENAAADAGAETPTESPTEVPTEESATPTPAPEPPQLLYKPRPAPECQLPAGAADSVPSGGAVDYDCVYKVKLIGARLAPPWIAIDWSLAVSITGGWTVQVMPLLPNDPNPVWIDAGGATPPILLNTGFAPDASSEVVDAFNNSAALKFRVRLARPVCDLEPAALQFNLTGTASLPDHADAAITTETEPAPEVPYHLAPTLAPIPAPALAFAGPLSFGTIGVTAAGPTSPVAAGSVDLIVSNLDSACGSWTVGLQAQALSGSNGGQISANTLTLTSINGQPLDGGPCDLASGCRFAAVQAGPGAAAVTLTLGVSLAVPDQPGVGTFDSTLTASVTRAQ